jgi:alanyl-tRNA synthetase
LIRRATFCTNKKHLQKNEIIALVDSIMSVYKDIYSINESKDLIINEIEKEVNKFDEAKAHGLKELSKIQGNTISAEDAFKLFSSYGFPLELTIDHAKSNNKTVDIKGFNELMKKHQELSRAGAEQKFKGGLADSNDPQVVRYHTATHLLHQALHDVLGEDNAGQKGSNITAERLRFDFSYGTKMTDEQKKKVEEIINQKIKEKLPVQNIVLPREEAEKTGARHFFGEKYGDQISIYFIGKDLDSAYSKEFCGGPHVMNTSELAGPEGKWKFKIQKEEASSQGVRRIKAVLE